MLDVLMSTGERRPVWGEPMGDQEMVQALAWRDLVLRGVPSLSGGRGSIGLSRSDPVEAERQQTMAERFGGRAPPPPTVEIVDDVW